MKAKPDSLAADGFISRIEDGSIMALGFARSLPSIYDLRQANGGSILNPTVELWQHMSLVCAA